MTIAISTGWYDPPVRHRQPQPVIILVDGPTPPTVGDPCAWCCTALTTGYVVSARVGYCNNQCVEDALHCCTDCGGDVREPAGPGMPGCNHRPGWLAGGEDLPAITLAGLVQPAPITDPALADAA